MIHLPASVRVYLCLTPCDMRKSDAGGSIRIVESAGGVVILRIYRQLRQSGSVRKRPTVG
jgi:hypothetical protein